MDNNEHEEETIKKRFTFPDGTPACEIEYSTEEHRVYRMTATIEFHRVFPASDTFEEASSKMLEQVKKYPNEYSELGAIKGLSIQQTDEVFSDEEAGMDRCLDYDWHARRSKD